MRYRYHIVDVFTETPFGGNQLAVLPDASGISATGMQKIAREFNFAETTFVTPPRDAANTRRVRIFTPNAELPFAGHPTVGTACALVMGNHVAQGEQRLVLEEGVGSVAVDIERRRGVLHATLTLERDIEQPAARPSKAALASVLSLHPDDVLRAFFASAGLPFCFTHLAHHEAVDRARLDMRAWTEHLSQAWSSNVFLFAGEPHNGSELYARMWAPALGVEEDPATGSACAALVGALASERGSAGNLYRLSVIQGVKMGRPSHIEGSAHAVSGRVKSMSVGGATAYVASGEMEIPAELLDA